MEQNVDLDPSVHGQGPTTSFAGDNFALTSQNDRSLSPSLSHGIKRKHSRLNEADESCSTSSEDLLNQLQTECKKKNDQLKIYSDYIDMLKSNCDEKDHLINQLKSEIGSEDRRLTAFNKQSNPNVINELQEECTNKEAQLVEMESKIKQLEKQIVNQSNRLKANADTIHELQTQSDGKDAKLIEMGGEIKQLEVVIVKQGNQLRVKQSEINKLQTSCADKDEKSEKKESIISDIRTRCNNMEAQLAEKDNLIGQLRSKRVENEADVQLIPENLAYLEEKLNSHFDTLLGLAEKCLRQKQYVKANVHYKEAINFEKSSQDRPHKLAMLFVSQSFCYGELKSYKQEVDAATSALNYDSNSKDALNNRAFAYFKLKKYSDARQDLEKNLQLDPNDADAQTLLEKIQSCINEANS